VILPKANRRLSRRFDRHLIENFFAKLKRLRAIATRYDKKRPGTFWPPSTSPPP
jgi:transposase